MTLHVDALKTAASMQVTVRVKHARQSCFRMWLGGRLLAWAAWIMPCAVQIDIEMPVRP